MYVFVNYLRIFFSNQFLNQSKSRAFKICKKIVFHRDTFILKFFDPVNLVGYLLKLKIFCKNFDPRYSNFHLFLTPLLKGCAHIHDEKKI